MSGEYLAAQWIDKEAATIGNVNGAVAMAITTIDENLRFNSEWLRQDTGLGLSGLAKAIETVSANKVVRSRALR